MNILSRKKQNGLSLLELLTTMAMVGIMASFAVPAFTDLINKNQQKAQINKVLNGLYIARSEAVKRGERTVFCPSSDGASCNSGVDWEAGWIVFIDDNTNNAVDAGETLVQVGQPMDTGFTLIGSANVADRVRYQPGGDALESGTMTLCDARGATDARAIIITASGKPKTSDTAAGGGALTCPS